MDYRETGGLDPLDRDLAGTAPAPDPVRIRGLDVLLRGRAALGLRTAAAPAVVFVPLGALLGPHGIGLLPGSALPHLYPALAVALAALGVFVGLELNLSVRSERRLFAAASVEAATTIAIVTLATLFLIGHWGLPLDATAGVVAVAMGVAASASSARAADQPGDRAHRRATRIADLDDGVLILAGAFVLVAAHARDVLEVLRGVGISLGIGFLVGIAGWLLFERARGHAERAVFVLGALALAGGGAAYLGSSPLLCGLVAGIVWRILPGHADRIIRADVSRYQHPLVVLLLIVAGAYITVEGLTLWLLGPFIVFRLVGKIVGAWFASAMLPSMSAADLAAYLLPPGLLGLASALAFVPISPTPTATAIASAVALGTVASELLAAIVLPGRGAART